MKFNKNKLIFLAILAVVLLNCLFCKNLKKKSQHTKAKQVQLTRDHNGFNSSVQQVVRRSPTVNTITKLGNYRLQPVATRIHMSNSNTSNLPNIGNLGNTAAIVEPHIVMHSKSPISVIKETPAHLGWRNEQQTITSLNLENGKAEHHTRTNKVPIYGNIEEVKTVYKNDVRSYDVGTRRFGPIVSNISAN